MKNKKSDKRLADIPPKYRDLWNTLCQLQAEVRYPVAAFLADPTRENLEDVLRRQRSMVRHLVEGTGYTGPVGVNTVKPTNI